MKALFLAGGFGTRLQPLTNDLPKPMVPIMTKPLLEQNMLKLKEHGVDEVILCTHFHHEKIEDYFGDGSQLGLKIHYVREDEPLGTGGAIKNAEEFFDDTFIVFNSDILTDIDITNMLQFHKEKKAAVTIAATHVDNPSAYGVIEYNSESYIESFTEKPQLSEIKSAYINAGIYIFEPQVLKEIPAHKNVSIERETYPLLLQKKYSMAIYKSDAYWMDIGTIEKYIEAHQDVLNKKCRLTYDNEFYPEKYIGKNTVISPTAKIFEPVHIGENVTIEAFATIGPHTVIGDDCKVGIHSSVVNSILWNEMEVGEFSTIKNMVITSNSVANRNIDYDNIDESK